MNLTIAQVIAKLPDALKQTAGLQRDYREKRIADRSVTFNAWKRENPERIRASHKRARATRDRLLREAIARATPAELEEVVKLMEAWKADPAWLCAYCEKPADAKDRTCDHVTALSRSGEHKASNLKPACRRCNSRKGTKPYYFV